MNSNKLSIDTGKSGTVKITAEGIVVPKTAGGKFANAGQYASLFGQTRFISADEIAFVLVGDRVSQYVTGKRAAGVILTGGIALLAPSKRRAALVIGLVGGESLTFEMQRKDASRVESIQAFLALHGYVVSLA